MISLKEIITLQGNDLATLSSHSSVFLIFLRHFGCVFCKEALRDLGLRNKQFKEENIRLVFVHMAPPEDADKYFTQFNVVNYDNISDPKSELYKKFGLKRGNFTQLYGLKTWIRGYKLHKEGMAFELPTIGDSLQLPGIFVICNGEIKDSYIHKIIADKPDYDMLINCCNPQITDQSLT